MPEPLVSVLINNYNYARYLEAAIDSALQQTYRNVEVVVVDDGSTDNSLEVIASYGDRIRSVIKENGGQGSAFNAGFAVCRGEIVSLLDADDWFMPEKIAEIVEVFQEGDYGWVFHTLRREPNEPAAVIDPTFHPGRWDYRFDMVQGKPIPALPTATSGLCFRRESLALILPMPEQIRIISDNYLKWAALALGPGFFSSAEVAVQRIHAGNLYTGNPGAAYLHAEMTLATACHLHHRLPHIRHFCADLGVGAIGELTPDVMVGSRYGAIIRHFLNAFSLRDRIWIIGRTMCRILFGPRPAQGAPLPRSPFTRESMWQHARASTKDL
jgi:glycosyltransferase involved in cell wall biosynthesis